MKRLIDILAALSGLIILSPILIIIAFSILISMGWPVFYRQVRVGKDGKPFGRTSRFTNVWVLKDGAWQCVSGHASAILPRP